MQLKEVFKPTVGKFILAIILMVLSLLYKRPNYCFDANCYPRGFPLPFLDQLISGFSIAHQKYIFYFIVDFVLYFLIVSVALLIFDTLKKK